MRQKVGTPWLAFNSIWAISLLAALGCGGDPTASEIVVRVVVSPDGDTVVVGEVSRRLGATAFNAQGDQITDASFSWRSTDPSVATIDSMTGAVAGLQAGQTGAIAAAGAIADTADVTVLAPVSVSLALDTILLAPGDTFTVLFEVRTVAGGAPTVSFGGGDSSVATIDPQTGLVVAIGAGVTPYIVIADSFTANGAIEVITVADTANGSLYLGLSGAVAKRFRLDSRGFNHPTDDARSVFVLNAIKDTDQFAVLLINSLTGPIQRPVGALSEADRTPPADPICRPPGSWAFYRDMLNEISFSLQGGTFSVTSFAIIPGGNAISGRFQIPLQEADTGSAGTTTGRGTFVVPLVSLSECPKGEANALFHFP